MMNTKAKEQTKTTYSLKREQKNPLWPTIQNSTWRSLQHKGWVTCVITNASDSHDLKKRPYLYLVFSFPTREWPPKTKRKCSFIQQAMIQLRTRFVLRFDLTSRADPPNYCRKTNPSTPRLPWQRVTLLQEETNNERTKLFCYLTWATSLPATQWYFMLTHTDVCF